MIRYNYMLLAVVVVIALVACSPSVTITPEVVSTDVAEASPQATTTLPATQEPTPSLAQTPRLVPTGTAAPLSEDDAFLLEMQSNGYSIAQSGSITDERGVVYSAYVFSNPKVDEIVFLGETVKETWLIAFYRWNGTENKLLNTFYPTVYDKRFPDGTYPRFLSLVSWDDPFRSFGYIDLVIIYLTNQCRFAIIYKKLWINHHIRATQ